MMQRAWLTVHVMLGARHVRHICAEAEASRHGLGPVEAGIKRTAEDSRRKPRQRMVLTSQICQPVSALLHCQGYMHARPGHGVGDCGNLGMPPSID